MYRIFTSAISTRSIRRVWSLLLCVWLTASFNPVRSQTLPCDAARAETHATSSSCAGCYVGNAAYAVDNNMITASSLILLPLSAGAYVQQTLQFGNANSQRDSIYLYLSFLSDITDMGILKSIQLATYNGSTYNNDRAVLAAPAFNIHFITPAQALISWAPARAFNKVEIRLTTGPATPLLKVDIHYANRGTAVPRVASSTVNACSGTSVLLDATGAPGTTLHWYTQASGGCPVYEGAQFQTPQLANDTITYYVEAAKGTCVNPQRTPLVVNVKPGVIKQWDKNYGGSSEDMLNVILPAGNGRYFLGGTTSSKDGDVTNPTGGTRAWVVKVGANKGGILWNRTYTYTDVTGSYNGSTVTSMIPASGGGYVLGGMVSPNPEPEYPWIAKIDSNGNKLWNKTFVVHTGYVHHYLAGIVPSNDGGYLLGGYIYIQGAFQADAWIIKTDANGNELWRKTLGGTGLDYLKSLLPAGDGGYFLGGSTKSVDGDISDGNNGGSDYWLMKIDANGNKSWDKTFGSSGDDQIACMQLTGDGGLLLGGGRGFKDGDVTDGGTGNIWLVKTDANGNKLWDKIVGSGTVRTIAPFGNDNFLLGIAERFLIKKIDTQGNVLWDQYLGGSSTDALYSILSTGNGSFFAGGLTYTSATEPGNGSSDAWLIKVVDNNCGFATGAVARVDSLPVLAAASPAAGKDSVQQTILAAYPNPFTRQLQLRYTIRKSGHVSLQLYNMQGKQITTMQSAIMQPGVYNLTVDGSRFASGTYICRLLLEGAMYSQTVIKL